MPKKLLLSLLFFYFAQLNAQTRSFDPGTCSTYYSKPGKFAINNQSLPFSEVKVIDKRFDTSKIGYARATTFRYSVIKTKNSFAEAIAKSITISTEGKRNADTSKKLLIVIRHFWLDGQPTDNYYKSSYTAGLDVYLKSNGQYSPLFRLDTFVATTKALLKTDDELIVSPFQICFEKLETFPVEQTILKRRKIDEAALLAYYQTRFEKAAVKDALAKGVYLNFESFLKGKPDYSEYRIVNGELSDVMYVTENGKETMIVKYWGFCDGQKNYIRMGVNFFELCRQNKTFDLMGLKSIDHPDLINHPELVPYGSIINAIKRAQPDKLRLKPLQLDMETGNVY